MFLYSILSLLYYLEELECEVVNQYNTSFSNDSKINPLLGIQSQQGSNWDFFHPFINQSIENKLSIILDKKSLFDEWISNVKPKNVYIAFNGTKQIENNYKFLVKLKNFTFFNERGKVLSVSDNVIDAIQRWLVLETGCPMDYVWSQLDINYWPRWVKKGICVSATSCSWPPGMTCKDKRKKKLPLLRWVCVEDFDNKKYLKAAREVDRDHQKLRQKRQNDIQNRVQTSRKRPRSRRRLLSAKQKEKKTRKNIFKLSKQVEGYFCKWEKVEYEVVDYCTCTC